MLCCGLCAVRGVDADCQYEPELFPGLIYRMVQPKIVLLIFVSGKIVLTGAKVCLTLCSSSSFDPFFSGHERGGERETKEIGRALFFMCVLRTVRSVIRPYVFAR